MAEILPTTKQKLILEILFKLCSLSPPPCLSLLLFQFVAMFSKYRFLLLVALALPTEATHKQARSQLSNRFRKRDYATQNPLPMVIVKVIFLSDTSNAPLQDL